MAGRAGSNISIRHHVKAAKNDQAGCRPNADCESEHELAVFCFAPFWSNLHESAMKNMHLRIVSRGPGMPKNQSWVGLTCGGLAGWVGTHSFCRDLPRSTGAPLLMMGPGDALGVGAWVLTKGMAADPSGIPGKGPMPGRLDEPGSILGCKPPGGICREGLPGTKPAPGCCTEPRRLLGKPPGAC